MEDDHCASMKAVWVFRCKKPVTGQLRKLKKTWKTITRGAIWIAEQSADKDGDGVKRCRESRNISDHETDEGACVGDGLQVESGVLHA